MVVKHVKGEFPPFHNFVFCVNEYTRIFFMCVVCEMTTLFFYWTLIDILYYTVSQKNDNDVPHYNFNANQPILISFGRDIAE